VSRDPPLPFLTIGHSTRELPDFLALLERHGVRQVVDVRTFPGSRRYPQFNRETLGAALEEVGIHYVHLPELGGRRRARPDSTNTRWRNAGFRGYADYMEEPEFRRGIDRLISLGSAATTAVMCAEAVPWRCHRSLISDALVARGVAVHHILDDGANPHALTRFARVVGDEVRYDMPDAAEAAGRPIVADAAPTPQTELFGASGTTPTTPAVRQLPNGRDRGSSQEPA
jgi:uncharacterized protein (DUF488 family)